MAKSYTGKDRWQNPPIDYPYERLNCTVENRIKSKTNGVLLIVTAYITNNSHPMHRKSGKRRGGGQKDQVQDWDIYSGLKSSRPVTPKGKA